MTRLNIQVLSAIKNYGAILIVDSTRKGKSFPDSFNRTIPIWATVMNRVIKRIKESRKSSSGEASICQQWDTELYLPPWIPEMDRDQISSQLDQWVDKMLLKSGFDFNTIIDSFKKPLRCIWISQKNSDISHINDDSLQQLPFHPLVLVSASDANYPEKLYGWSYIQGAGDDHQSWSLGLSPMLFWNNHGALLSCQHTSECENIIHDILEEEKKKDDFFDSKKASAICSLQVHADKSPVAKIGNTSMFVGSFLHVKSFEMFDAILLLSPTLPNHMKNISLPTLHLKIIDSKKDKSSLESKLSDALDFLDKHLKLNHKIFITCHSANSESIVACIAGLCALFSTDYTYVGRNQKLEHIDKSFIRNRLGYVQSFVPTASPSRNLMIQLNRFFLSGRLNKH